MNQDLGPAGPPEIGEAQLIESAPRVRALTIKRYEQIWSIVETEIKEAQELLKPMDPRLLEIGIRVLKEETALYRLGRPPLATEEEEDPIHAIDPRTQVLAELAELEARNKEQGK